MNTFLMMVSLMVPTYEREIKPIFMNRCYKCHDGVYRSTDWSEYSQVKLWSGDIRNRVVIYRTMPPKDNYITEEERILVDRWVEKGARK